MANRRPKEPQLTDEERAKRCDVRTEVSVLTKDVLTKLKGDVKTMSARERVDLLRALLPYNLDKNNELNNFVLPVVVSEDFLSELFASIEADPSTKVRVDLPNQTVTDTATGEQQSYAMDNLGSSFEFTSTEGEETHRFYISALREDGLY